MSTSVKLAHAQAVSPCPVCKEEASSHNIPCHNCGKVTMPKDSKEEPTTEKRDSDENSLKCTEHGSLALCHCDNCNTPVCIECITGKHQGHKMVDFAKVLMKEKQSLQVDIVRIQNNILPDLLKGREELKSKYEQNERNSKEILNHVNDESQYIKRIHDESIKCLTVIRDSNSEILQKFSKDIENEISFFDSKLTEYTDACEKSSLKEILEISEKKASSPIFERALKPKPNPELKELPLFESGNQQTIKDTLGKLIFPRSSRKMEPFQIRKSSPKRKVSPIRKLPVSPIRESSPVRIRTPKRESSPVRIRTRKRERIRDWRFNATSKFSKSSSFRSKTCALLCAFLFICLACYVCQVHVFSFPLPAILPTLESKIRSLLNESP